MIRKLLAFLFDYTPEALPITAERRRLLIDFTRRDAHND